MILSNQSRTDFAKLVASRFAKDGWSIDKGQPEHYDFIARVNRLRFPIQCLSQDLAQYRSVSYFIENIENSSNFILRNSNFLKIIVFERNFLGVALPTLRSRNIFAFEFDEIKDISGLKVVSTSPIDDVTPKQMEILRHNFEYAIFVSEWYQTKGDLGSAISWARGVVEAGTGFTSAHFRLFSLLVQMKDYDGAEKIGQEMVSYRPTDRKVIVAMMNLAIARGDLSDADKWKKKLLLDGINSTSLEKILTAQVKLGPIQSFDPLSDNKQPRYRKMISKALKVFISS